MNKEDINILEDRHICSGIISVVISIHFRLCEPFAFRQKQFVLPVTHFHLIKLITLKKICNKQCITLFAVLFPKAECTLEGCVAGTCRPRTSCARALKPAQTPPATKRQIATIDKLPSCLGLVTTYRTFDLSLSYAYTF